MTSKIVEKITDGEHTYTLLELDRAWAPWEWQLITVVRDGKSYGSPGVPCTISTSKFESRPDFEEYVARNREIYGRRRAS